MAVAPSVQLAFNGDKTEVFWDLNLDGSYVRWNLYRAITCGVDDALLAGNIPNIADAYYSKHHVTLAFARPFNSITPYYLWLKGIEPGGAEGAAGTVLYVPSLLEIDPTIRQKGYGFDPDTNVWRPIKVEKDTDPSIAGVLDVTP